MSNEAYRGEAFTRKQYDAFVEESGHTPTQDPIYNHHAGSPRARTSVAQENFLQAHGSVGAAIDPEVTHIESVASGAEPVPLDTQV